MAVQSIWSGTISFSLVAIPVRLVKAVEPGRIPFHLLHAGDYSRLSRRMVCSADGVEVAADETVRGFEIMPERYVLLSDEELASVSPERSRTFEIVEFIDPAEIDPVYFDHPYYLVPAKGGEKAYQLLTDVLVRTNKAGLAKFVLAEREHLAVLIPQDGALAVMTLHYHDEVRQEEAAASKAADQALADRMRAGIATLLRDFDPASYGDERRKSVTELLARKLREQAPVEAPQTTREESAGPPDLVAALEESMRRVKEGR